MKRIGAVLAICLIAFSLIGITLNLYGEFFPDKTEILPGLPNQPQDYQGRSLLPDNALNEFNALAGSAPPLSEETARKVFSLVSASFIHAPSYANEIRPQDNWIMWIRGLGNPRYRYSQDGEYLWKRGEGFCDQAAAIYVQAVKSLGFRARLIWLEGHVITEVRLSDGSGRLVDPDVGVFWDFGLADLGSAFTREHFRARLAAEGFSPSLIEIHENAYFSLENNRATGFPYLPKQYQFEQTSLYLSKILPWVGLFLGVGIMGMMRRKSRGAQ